jgi:hypothetical protein
MGRIVVFCIRGVVCPFVNNWAIGTVVSTPAVEPGKGIQGMSSELKMESVDLRLHSQSLKGRVAHE